MKLTKGMTYKSQNNMQSYIVIKGERIELSEESANNIEQSLKKEPIEIGDYNSQFSLQLDSPVQIGKGAVPAELRGKCLVIKNGIKIVVEENDDFIFSQRILFFKE